MMTFTHPKLDSSRWLPLTLAAALVLAAAPGSAQQGNAAGADTMRVFDLKACVDLALQDSPNLAIARAQRDQAAQDVTTAYGAFLPNLAVSHSYRKSDRTDFDNMQTIYADTLFDFVDSAGDILQLPGTVPVGTVTSDLKSKSTYKDIQLQSQMNLFNGFSKFSALSSAKHSLRAAELNEEYGRELVVQNVAGAYYDLLRYESLLEVSNESRDLAARELEKTETYFRLGSAAKSDVLQARVRLEQTKLEVVQGENAVAQAFANLAYAMNQPLADRFRIDRSPLRTTFELESVEDLYDEALGARLDLQSSEETLAARKKDVQTNSSGLWPSVNAFLSYTRYRNETPSLLRLGAQESDATTYGYSVSWNVFDRFQNWTRRSQAKAGARIAEYNLEQARLDAQLEIRQIYNALVESRKRVDLSRETIVQAQEELRLAQERFRVGAGTTLDRINAEVNLSSARTDEVQAICDFLINKVKLDRAVGRISPYLGG